MPGVVDSRLPATFTVFTVPHSLNHPRTRRTAASSPCSSSIVRQGFRTLRAVAIVNRLPGPASFKLETKTSVPSDLAIFQRVRVG